MVLTNAFDWNVEGYRTIYYVGPRGENVSAAQNILSEAYDMEKPVNTLNAYVFRQKK